MIQEMSYPSTINQHQYPSCLSGRYARTVVKYKFGQSYNLQKKYILKLCGQAWTD